MSGINKAGGVNPFLTKGYKRAAPGSRMRVNASFGQIKLDMTVIFIREGQLYKGKVIVKQTDGRTEDSIKLGKLEFWDVSDDCVSVHAAKGHVENFWARDLNVAWGILDK